MSNTNLIKTDSDALELAEAINKADYEHYLWKQAMKDYQSRIACTDRDWETPISCLWMLLVYH